jgi:hypothetical protein
MQAKASEAVNTNRKNDEAPASAKATAWQANDECRINDQARMPKGCYDLVGSSDLVIRHSDFVIPFPHCRMSILRRNFCSVRGYGLRTYEPRQGRNAATVV